MTRFDCSVSRFQCSNNLIQHVQIQTQARFVLVVEKETVFQRLEDMQFTERWQCILMTGQGFPSFDCRKLLRLLAEQTDLPILGLFDHNPSGIEIFLTYKLGTPHGGVEGYLQTIEKLSWIGIFRSDIEEFADPGSFKLITDRDRSIIRKLEKDKYVMRDQVILKELESIKSSGTKAEIECINDSSFDTLVQLLLPRKILVHCGNWDTLPQ